MTTGNTVLCHSCWRRQAVHNKRIVTHMRRRNGHLERCPGGGRGV